MPLRTGSDVPNSRSFAITPGTADLTAETKKIYVGVTGHLVIVTPDGTEQVLQNVPAGFHEIKASKVLAITAASGSPNYTTTAGALIGFY